MCGIFFFLDVQNFDGHIMAVSGSANMGARTWSKPSLPDSASQAVGNIRAKTMSPLPFMGKGIVVSTILQLFWGISCAPYLDISKTVLRFEPQQAWLAILS